MSYQVVNSQANTETSKCLTLFKLSNASANYKLQTKAKNKLKNNHTLLSNLVPELSTKNKYSRNATITAHPNHIPNQRKNEDWFHHTWAYINACDAHPSS